MKPIIAIVGRPNVGKSTLFNRITRSRSALVDDMPGVTRDRHYGDAEYNGVAFCLVDTGGFISTDDDPFSGQIRRNVIQAIDDADAVVLLLDGKSGVSPYDREMVDLLRKKTKPVYYLVNKIDGPGQEAALTDFYSLGLDVLYPVSSEHRYGLSDFLDDLVAHLPLPDTEASEADDPVRIAVVGRPNVGKSSLINRLVGEDRHIVSDVPGTTRDAVDTPYTRSGRSYLLVDTAGIRRKGRVSQKLEKFSIVKALRSLDRCDVALIVIDAAEGVTDQDISVAGYAHDRGCGAVFLLNKWDLVEKDHRTVRRFMEDLRWQAKFLAFAPAVTISAKTGQRVNRIFEMVDHVFAQYSTRIGTGDVNRIIQQATDRNEPPLHRGRRLKFYYTVQAGIKPPTFISFVNFPGAVHFSYKRFLVNQIREQSGLDQTPIRLIFRERSGRMVFDDGSKKPAGGKKRRKRK